MQILKNFGVGTAHILKGWRFLLQHRSLWIYALLPTLINLLLLSLMVGFFSTFYDEVYRWLTDSLGHLDIVNPTTWYLHIFDGLLWMLDKFFQLLLILLSLMLMLLLFYGFGFIIAAPFNDLLSEKVERLVTGKTAEIFLWKTFFTNILRTLKTELVKTLFFLGIPLLFLLITLFPLLGTFLYPLLTISFGMFDLGFNYVDYPMSRNMLSFRERLQFSRSHSTTLMGFGLPFLVPFANFFLMAPLVVGGTLLYLTLSQKVTRDYDS